MRIYPGTALSRSMTSVSYRGDSWETCFGSSCRISYVRRREREGLRSKDGVIVEMTCGTGVLIRSPAAVMGEKTASICGHHGIVRREVRDQKCAEKEKIKESSHVSRYTAEWLPSRAVFSSPLFCRVLFVISLIVLCVFKASYLSFRFVPFFCSFDCVLFSPDALTVRHQVLAERLGSLESGKVPPLLLLPMYSQLPADLQAKIFDSAEEGVRK